VPKFNKMTGVKIIKISIGVQIIEQNWNYTFSIVFLNAILSIFSH